MTRQCSAEPYLLETPCGTLHWPGSDIYYLLWCSGVFVGDDWPEHKVDPDTNMRGSHYDGRVWWLVVPAVAQYRVEYYIVIQQ